MAKPPKFTIESIHAVGQYAIGVRWMDQHESIFPFTHLRRLCPCIDCGKSQAVKREPSEPGRELKSIQQIADASVMLRWGDEHESLFLVEELREICGCAACRGEPQYPITGQ